MMLDAACIHAIDAAWDYLDGELDPVTVAKIDRHLSVCPRCRARYGFERRFLASLATLGNQPVDVSALRPRILAALARDEYH